MRQGDFSYQPKVGEGLFNAVLHDRGGDVPGNGYYFLHAAAAALKGHSLDSGAGMGIGSAAHRHMPLFRQPCHGASGGRGDGLGFPVNDGSVYGKKYDLGRSRFRGIA